MAGAPDGGGARDEEPGSGAPAASRRSGRGGAGPARRRAGQSAPCSQSGAGLKPGAAVGGVTRSGAGDVGASGCGLCGAVRMRARLARRVCVRAGGGGRGRRALRGVPERRLRRRTRAGRERLGCPRPPPRLLGPPRSAPRPRLPCRLRATPACRARGCAARGPVRAVAPSCRLHRPRAAGTATPPPGLDAARNAVVRRGELGGELERAGYEAAGGGGSTRSSLRLIGASAGLFRGPDRCCREHDQCWAQITALQFNYGIRNYRLHTVSHCDCDTRFRQCLLAINDTVSNIIGVTFFNLLEVPCFVLEESEECIQWHWWGGCERYGVVPLARMVQQNQYHPSLPAEERGSPTVQPPGKGRNFSRTGRKELRAKPGRRQAGRPKTAPQPQGPGTPVSARDKAELTTRHPAVQWGLEPGRATASTVSGQDLLGPEQGAGISARPRCGSLGPSPATAQCGATPVPAVKGRRQQGLGRGCRCTKHLRKCEHQIAPHEVRYQLHNVDSRTLFHCNCMRRLARCLHRARDCSDMDLAVLADRITMDCFVLELPAACSPSRESQHSCTMMTRAVLVPAQQLKKILRRWGPLRVSSKAKHLHWKTHARGGILCEQCQHLVVEQTPA
ncbi:group 3 secretory phospholipase A2 isoform X2 [Zonotrichia albicollis]|uniref:group 3 secretory phospholipase A2 isoform X2 n=1 Tax=Zonotrichia albicollis TaxID=44394 RepID=UPI003D81177C